MEPFGKGVWSRLDFYCSPWRGLLSQTAADNRGLVEQREKKKVELKCNFGGTWRRRIQRQKRKVNGYFGNI